MRALGEGYPAAREDFTRFIARKATLYYKVSFAVSGAAPAAASVYFATSLPASTTLSLALSSA